MKTHKRPPIVEGSNRPCAWRPRADDFLQSLPTLHASLRYMDLWGLSSSRPDIWGLSSSRPVARLLMTALERAEQAAATGPQRIPVVAIRFTHHTR